MIDFIFYTVAILSLLISVSPFYASWDNYWICKAIIYERHLEKEREILFNIKKEQEEWKIVSFQTKGNS